MCRLVVSAAISINILGNVAKYDRSHLRLHLQEDRLSDIYATIADDLELRARTQNRLLAVTIPHDLPTIAADQRKLDRSDGQSRRQCYQV